MKSHLFRAVTAMGLGLSLWVTTVAALAAPQTPDQTKGQDQTKQATAQKDKDKSAQPAAQTSSNKPLSINDDPTMIGKRNINKGLWGKIAAGTEKEVKMGRMLAAEVDKEAKFIDDPMITEYVNRVGQKHRAALRRQSSFYDQSDRFRRSERLCAAGWFLLCK